MSNHSPEHEQEMNSSLADFARKLGLGPTKKFPEGKITPKDEGEIKIAVTVKNNIVILAFGAPVAWMGFQKEQAKGLAKLLSDKAETIEEVKKEEGALE
jgi:hypothetical protein